MQGNLAGEMQTLKKYPFEVMEMTSKDTKGSINYIQELNDEINFRIVIGNPRLNN